MKTVVAYSYDIDGCILLKKTPPGIQDIINYHHDKLFKAQKNETAKKYVFCGSSRQTPYHDFNVSIRYRDPLATDLLNAVAQHIDAIYNTYFFGDIATYIDDYNDSFTPIFDKRSPGSLHSNRKDVSKRIFAFVDYLKVIMIYSQISNLCVHEPDADEITFNFYDDRLDVLHAIESYFKRYPQLFLKKVKLNLWHYSECDFVTVPKLIASINGTCEKPHTNYYLVIQKLIENNKITPIYDKSISRKILIFKEDETNPAFIDELVQLGTNGQLSHQPGEGLIDYRKTCSHKTLILSNEGKPPIDSTGAENGKSFCFF